MDSKLLVEETINEGQRLLANLVSAGFDLTSAFWVCKSREELRDLHICSATLAPEKKGDAYRMVYDRLGRNPDPVIALSDVRVVGIDDPRAKAVLEIQRLHPGKALRWLARPSLVREGIEVAYIYPPDILESDDGTDDAMMREMYKIIAPPGFHLFLYDNPKQQGFDGEVQENVRLALPEEGWHEWPRGAPPPDICLGVSPKDEKRYRVFRTTEDCRRARFQPLGPNYAIFADWAQYQRITAA